MTACRNAREQARPAYERAWERLQQAPTLDGVAPTQANARSGKYPIVRKLYMNTKGEAQGLTAAFIKYILGPDGKQMTAAVGYLPL